MTTSLVFFVPLLLALTAEGLPSSRSTCRCSTNLLKSVNLRIIKREPLVYHSSAFCPRTEIIVTIKSKEKCLDPESDVGKLILRMKNRHSKDMAIRRTTATVQRLTLSPTKRQQTFRVSEMGSEQSAGTPATSAPFQTAAVKATPHSD